MDGGGGGKEAGESDEEGDGGRDLQQCEELTAESGSKQEQAGECA
ncbi:MAG: hypothetical protein RLZZ458_3215, partial [Planctomycetota bacterium]